MNPAESVSVVLPVRNMQHLVTQRVEQMIGAMEKLSRSIYEIVVVDDGSADETPNIVRKMESDDDRIRLLRHSRPRGIEAAGQTGLERSRGELIFIQETISDVRIEDLLRLYRMSADRTIVVARVESCARPIAPALLRRLQAWGTHAKHTLERIDRPGSSAGRSSSLQMIRRPHLKTLKSPQGCHYQLVGETIVETIRKAV